MNLKLLQDNLLDIIKSRTGRAPVDDVYLKQVTGSPNLNLAKKTIHWWRKTQVANYCVLTANLLMAYGTFDQCINQFIKTDFSVFRDEVGLGFIDFVCSRKPYPLVTAVAMFEKALMLLKAGNPVEETIVWPCEPFAVIEALLGGTFNQLAPQPGNYEVQVSKTFGQQLFRVYHIVQQADVAMPVDEAI